MLKLRIITASILAPLVIAGILLLPASLFAEAVMLLLVIGLFEWDGLTTRSNGFFVGGALAVLLAAFLSYLLATGVISAPISLLLPVIALIGTLFWIAQYFVLAKGIDYQRSKPVEMLLGMLAVLCAWAGMVWLRLHHEQGTTMVLIAIMVVWAADTFAYFAGVNFGKRKLAPSISPGKTVEGVIGGMLGAIGFSGVAAHFLLDLDTGSLVRWLIATAAAAAISVVGDLYISRLKRQVGAKDSGKLLPGHGGILDRIDGLIAAMPVFAAVWWLLW